MRCGIQLNDVGTDFKITIKDCNNSAIDISSATSTNIIFKKPSGSILTKTASFYTDGTDGIIHYVTESGDLDEAGTWKIQAVVTTSSGSWNSHFESFKVNRNL